MNWKFWRKNKGAGLMKVDDGQQAGWIDILNPHGDGTLRPGDEVYDRMMNGNGGIIVGNFRDGKWDIEENDK